MSVFDAKSRYVRHAPPTQAVDRRGRRVACVTPAEPPAPPELGLHRRRQGQRLDHLADHYLGDPAGFWRIAEANDAMTPDAALARPLVRIPGRGRAMGFGIVVTSGEALAAMPDDVLRWLVEARIELEHSEPTRFALRFEDDLCEGEPRVEGAEEIAANRKIGLFLPEGDALVGLVLGPVTEIKSSTATGGTGSWVEARGGSRLVELDRIGVQATYTGLASAAATRLLQGYGFTADCQDTLIAYDEQRIRLTQRGTDLAFLQEIAQRNNMELWLDYAVTPPAGAGPITLGETAKLRTSPAPSQTIGAPAPPVLQAPADRVLRVNPPRGQCPSVTKFEVDIDDEKPAAARGFTIGEGGSQAVVQHVLEAAEPLDPDRLPRVEGVERELIIPPEVSDEEQALAQDALVTEQSWFAEVEASTSLEQAGFVILPHQIVQVSHAGPRLSGAYQVTKATYVVTATDCLVDVTLRANGLGGRR